MASRESNRVREADRRRVLDAAARNRRARKALEALEQDNFHDDPHADLVMSKKVPKFHDTMHHDSTAGASSMAGGSSAVGQRHKNGANGSRSRRTTDFVRARYRKTFAQLLEEDKNLGGGGGSSSGRGTNTINYDEDALGGYVGSGVQQQNGGGTAATAAAAGTGGGGGSYANAQAPPSRRPQRHFCAVCGFQSTYTCTSCGTRYCSIRCLQTHRDTRCLKWTA